VDFVDVNSRMLGPGGAIRPGIFVDDQLHMNRKGYRIWRDVIGEYLTRALASE
jgi:lysophospholipase L1-like esterase